MSIVLNCIVVIVIRQNQLLSDKTSCYQTKPAVIRQNQVLSDKTRCYQS